MEEEVGGGRVGGRGLLSTGKPWGRGRGRVSGREGAVIYRYTTGMGEWEGGGIIYR